MSRELFLNHRPDEAALKKIEKIKAAGIELYALISEHVPMGEEKDEAKKLVRSAVMWAVNGVVQPYPAMELGERYEEQKKDV